MEPTPDKMPTPEEKPTPEEIAASQAAFFQLMRRQLALAPSGSVAEVPAEKIHVVFGPDAGTLVRAGAAAAGLSIKVTKSPPWLYEFRLAPRK